jgi:hypothetical protein
MLRRERLVSRLTVAALTACLGVGALALPASGVSHDPVAVTSKKKCKRKHHGHKKKRRCKRRITPVVPPTPAALTISPTAHDFGMPGSSPGPSFDFVVSNIGGSPSGAPTASLSGQTDEFQIAASTCTVPLPPAATCTVTIQTVGVSGGVRTAQLNVVATPGGAVAATMMVQFI